MLTRLRHAVADRYDLEGEIGRGGMATVFRARDRRHGRTVAVKVLHPDLADVLGAERFEREVQITAQLGHPNILPLLDSGDADGLLYYVMPFAEGESLRQRLVREGPLDVGTALRFTRELADALAHAHARGVLHRDVKPENVLLVGDHAVIADFGIARAVDPDMAERLTQTGVVIGTPLYMSPEQSAGESTIDGRSDQFALAAVAYEMLTGEAPFTGPNAAAISWRKLTEPVPSLRGRRSSVEAHVAAAIERALSPLPADRFRDLRAFAAALDQPPGFASPEARASGHVSGGDAAGAAAAAATLASDRPRRSRLGVSALIIAAVAVVMVAIISLLRQEPTAPLTAEGTNVGASIAVLPFEHLGADSGQSYIADGLTDEIITSLSMVDGMRVASRTSSALLAREGLEIAQLGERLGVGAVLEGSVRASGDRVRVAARLVDVAGGYQRWSQTYERDIDDVFRIQEELAGAIASALIGELGASQATAIRSGTTDPEAYDLYLQGRSLRLRQTQQALQRAVELFRASIAEAPDFARAHAGLGEALAVIGFYEYQSPRDVFPEAAEAAERALTLDPRNGSAYATAAYVALYFDWDLPRAERLFLRALDVEPNSAIAHQWYANYLTVDRRFDEAEAEFQRARQLDPLAPVRQAAPIWAQFYRGDAARAVETYRRVIAIDSSYALTFQWGAMALRATGATEEAVRAARWAYTISNSGVAFAVSLAEMLAAHGDADSARVLLQRAEAAPVVPAYDVAKAYQALGDRGSALRWLRRAFAQRSHSMVLLRTDPTFAALRDDPEFAAIVADVSASPSR